MVSLSDGIKWLYINDFEITSMMLYYSVIGCILMVWENYNYEIYIYKWMLDSNMCEVIK